MASKKKVSKKRSKAAKLGWERRRLREAREERARKLAKRKRLAKKAIKKKPKKVVKRKPTKKIVKTKSKLPGKPTKRKVKRKRTPVHIRTVGDAEGFSDEVSKEAQLSLVMTSSHGNRNTPTEERVVKIFEKMLKGSLNKGPHEWDEVNVYRHGVLFRPRQGEWTKAIENKIVKIVSETAGASIHLVNEGPTFAIRLSFGSATEPISASEAKNSMGDNANTIRRVYDTLYEYFGEDIDWFDFVDTDEAPY